MCSYLPSRNLASAALASSSVSLSSEVWKVRFGDKWYSTVFLKLNLICLEKWFFRLEINFEKVWITWTLQWTYCLSQRQFSFFIWLDIFKCIRIRWPLRGGFKAGVSRTRERRSLNAVCAVAVSGESFPEISCDNYKTTQSNWLEAYTHSVTSGNRIDAKIQSICIHGKQPLAI